LNCSNDFCLIGKILQWLEFFTGKKKRERRERERERERVSA